jgi:hypothetical protein
MRNAVLYRVISRTVIFGHWDHGGAAGDSGNETPLPPFQPLAPFKKMSRYFLTPLAGADIFAIWTYITRDSEDAADRAERAIYDACTLVAESPTWGALTIRSLRF